MRIAIVRPLYDGGEFEFQEPCGAQAICGFILKYGYECRVFDRRLGATVSQIDAYSPNCIGFSVMTAEDVSDALKLLLILRKSDRYFFAGGLFVTTEYQKAKALFPADTFLVSGEGELEVLNYLFKLENRPLLPQKHLSPNDWAFQSRENIEKYIENGGVVNIRSSRGCRGTCSFCTTPCLPKPFNKYEARDIKLVVDEMENVINRGIKPVVNFTDDEFGDCSRIFELENEVQKRNLRIAFSLELRAREMVKIKDSDWKDLHSGGLCRIFTGLESVNEETLKSWKKNINIEKLFSSISECKKNDIVCETGYILWHPKQTVKCALNEIEILRQQDLFTPKVALSRLILYPESELYRLYNCNCTTFAPLTDEASLFYVELSKVIYPLMTLRNRCAILLPGVACNSFLTGNNNKKVKLEKLTDEINCLSYDVITKNMTYNNNILLRLSGEINEICSSD